MHRSDYVMLASVMRDAKASIPALFGGEAEHNAERMLSIIIDKLSVVLQKDNTSFNPEKFKVHCNHSF